MEKWMEKITQNRNETEEKKYDGDVDDNDETIKE